MPTLPAFTNVIHKYLLLGSFRDRSYLVVSRLTGVCSHVKGKYGGPLGREIAKGLYDGMAGKEGVDSGVVNQALMELGATYQSKVRGA